MLLCFLMGMDPCLWIVKLGFRDSGLNSRSYRFMEKSVVVYFVVGIIRRGLMLYF
jgi:hypothetical protein